MAEKKHQQCFHDKRVQEEDAFLDQIDKVLAENEWHDTPRLVRRVGRVRKREVGTTEKPGPSLSP